MGRRFLLLPAESEAELSRGDRVLVSPAAAAQSRWRLGGARAVEPIRDEHARDRANLPVA